MGTGHAVIQAKEKLADYDGDVMVQMCIRDRVNNGDFILRIEDTDQNRYTAGSEQMIFDALHWLCLLYTSRCV